MEPTHLNDADLLTKTKALAREESQITQNILEHLRVIESRRLYAKRGFPSLFEFCVKELGYSESSAQRRISAMRLIKSIPEAKEKLQNGEVNLSTLSQLQNFIRKEETSKSVKLNPEQKLELLSVIENKSQRECEKEFIKLSPEVANQKEENIRQVSNELAELKVTVPIEFIKKLEELKNLLSHRNKTNSMAELLEIISDIALEKVVPKRTSAAEVKQEAHPAPKQSRYIPVQIRNEIYQRDNGECQYIDPITKRKCRSKYKIQYEHIVPVALKGETSKENLTIHCATHNQLAAINIFGAKKMSTYVHGLIERDG